MKWFCFIPYFIMLYYSYITPKFPCKSGWKTPLKEHRLYLQLVEPKMLLTIFWHWEKFPVPL